jgi:4-diphosphocytidyl-2-C-methyl-D-erythritol kinase
LALELFAPAKINLTLDVLGKRPDGYHELETVMQTVSLGDTIELADASGIEVISEHPAVPKGPENLAYRAAALVQEHAGIKRGVRIIIKKRIPVAAGLAGGSTDAAAVLKGLDKLWSLGLPENDLLVLASQLGSDVAFCLHGGTALGKGRGEQLTSLPPMPKFGVVLVKLPIAVSTKEVYQRYRRDEMQKPTTAAMVSALQQCNRQSIMKAMSNMLESVTIPMHPEIAEIKEQMHKAGAQAVLMSGSGPTVFGLTETVHGAEKVAGYMRERMRDAVYTAETLHTI